MYLLVGLGNPGSKYKKNRHNVGHMTIDMIVKKYNLKKKNKNKFGDIFEGHLSNEKIFALFFEIFSNTNFFPSRNLVYESVNFIPERRIDFALK